MKFVDFGDLVEVTYDDESVELVTKEHAYTLGYSERQEIQITYQGKIYNSLQFSALTQIPHVTIRNYYKRGLRTGEEIISTYSKKIATQEVKIVYQGKIYNGRQFSTYTQIPASTVCKIYKKGYCTGEEIIEAYKKQKENKQDIKITYNGNLYNSYQFSRITSIDVATINKYYKRGLCTGEEIIEAYKKQKENRQDIKITYNGNLYNSKQFSAYAQIPDSTVCVYYSKGLRTGEEIIEAYKKQKNSTQEIKITYQGNMYTSTQFSTYTQISYAIIRRYYKKGLTTGEEIIAEYNKQKMARQEIKITYQGEVYNSNQFGKLTGICDQTISKYYKKGIRTGEEMIAYYNRKK